MPSRRSILRAAASRADGGVPPSPFALGPRPAPPLPWCARPPARRAQDPLPALPAVPPVAGLRAGLLALPAMAGGRRRAI